MTVTYAKIEVPGASEDILRKLSAEAAELESDLRGRDPQDPTDEDLLHAAARRRAEIARAASEFLKAHGFKPNGLSPRKIPGL